MAAGSILVVEDDDAVRETLREVIADEGYAVAEATNGEEALAYLRDHPAPCLVVLDLMMPVCNGQQFLERAERDPRLASLQVLVVSAASRETLGAVAGRGVVGVLAKPVELNALLGAIARYC